MPPRRYSNSSGRTVRGLARRSHVAAERLQLGLLIGADHVLVRATAACPRRPGVEVQHPAGLHGEVGVAREDPGARLPRLDRVFVQPAPDRRGRRLGDRPLDHQAVQLNPGEARSGSPWLRGSSHAIALTSATCSGGKTARSTRPRLILKPIKPILSEPVFASRPIPGGRVQPGRDIGVLHPLGRVQDHPRPLHVLERQLLRLRATAPAPRAPARLSTRSVPGWTRHRYITSPPPGKFLQTFRRVLPDGCTRSSIQDSLIPFSHAGCPALSGNGG